MIDHKVTVLNDDEDNQVQVKSNIDFGMGNSVSE
jgi:hypothetical protein